MRLLTPLLAFALFIMTAPFALSQEDEGLDTLPSKVLTAKAAAKRDLRGLRIARPGALAFASYDSDGSLTVSDDEIRSGAARSFSTADVNGDGFMSIFEQQDWAAAIGAHDGALANSTTFDANFDRRISEAEFIEGMIRLSHAYKNADSGVLRLSDLLEPPAGGAKPSSDLYEKPADNRPDKVDRSGWTPR